MRYTLTAFIIISVSLTYPCSSSAYEMDTDILNIYLSDDPEKLGAGGVDLHIESGETDLHHPAKLAETNESFISYTFEDENVLNDDDGDTEIKSRQTTTKGLLNLKVSGKTRAAIAFEFYDERSSGYTVQRKDDFFFGYKKNTESGNVAVAIRPIDSLTIGYGQETYNGNIEGYQEIRLNPSPAFEVGLREFKRDFNLDFALEKDGMRGEIPISHSEEVQELSIKLNMEEVIKLHAVYDMDRHDRQTFEFSSRISEGLSLTYYENEGGFSFAEDLQVEGVGRGDIHGDAAFSVTGYGLEYERLNGTKYSLGLRELEFNIGGGGIVDAGATFNFWADLLAGDRYYNYNLGLKSDQYYLGIDKKWSDSLQLRGGLQYILIWPEGDFNNWTPFPFLPIIRLDEQNMAMEYDEIDLAIITGGFSYFIGNIELSYAIGQYIPVDTKEKKKAGAGGGGGGGTSDSDNDGRNITLEDLKELWDKIRSSPGGTLQVLQVKWRF